MAVQRCTRRWNGLRSKKLCRVPSVEAAGDVPDGLCDYRCDEEGVEASWNGRGSSERVGSRDRELHKTKDAGVMTRWKVRVCFCVGVEDSRSQRRKTFQKRVYPAWQAQQHCFHLRFNLRASLVSSATHASLVGLQPLSSSASFYTSRPCAVYSNMRCTCHHQGSQHTMWLSTPHCSI